MAQLQSTGITGSLTVTTGSATELLVTNTGVRIGNVIGDTHTVTGSLNISGSLGTVGTITATTLVVQTITSSVATVTGSTKFGTLVTDTHQFTGSILQSGSLAYFAGNVGIGTSSPGVKLEVAGTIVAGIYNNTRGQITSNGVFSEFYSTEANPRWTISRDLIGGGQAGIGFNDTAGTIAATGAAIGGSINRTLVFYTSNGTSLTERARIDANGNVGIGNTSPSTFNQRVTAPHVVIGTGTGSPGLTIYSSTTDQASVNFAIGTTTTQQYDGGFVYVPNSGSPYLTFHVNAGAERMRITSGGFVGIGTTSPSGRLHIKSSGLGTYPLLIQRAANTNNIFYIFEDASGNGVINLENSGGTVGAYIHSSGNSYFNGGNVGIGTTNPGYLLDVYGTTTTTLRIRGGSTGYTQGALLIQSSTTDSPQGRGLGVYTFNEGTDATWFFGNGYSYGDAFIINRKSGSAFDISAAAPAEASNFFIVTNTGNVGIGTTSPTQNLQVNGGVYLASSTLGNTARVGIGTTSFSGANPKFGVKNDYADYAVQFEASTTTGASYGLRVLAGTNSSDASFIVGNASNTSTYFIIKGDGNVGIGSTSPAAKLDVAGIARFGSAAEKPTLGGYTDTFTGYYSIITSNNHGDFTFASNLTITTAHQLTTVNAHSAMKGAAIVLGGNGYDLGANTIAFFSEPVGAATASVIVSASSAEMVLRGTNLGIGTTNPSFTLDVAGNIGINGRLFAFNSATYTQITDPAGGIKLYLGASGDPGNYYDNTSHSFRSIGGSTVYAVIVSSGNVGIGTTSPSSKLEIKGIGSSGAADYGALTLSSGSSGLTFGWDYTNDRSYIYSRNSGVASKPLNINETMYVIGYGNVGIGSTTPAFKLDVYSTTSATARFYNNQATATFDFGSATNTSYSDIILRASSGTGEIFKAGTGYTSYGGVNALNIYNSNAGIHFFPNGTGTSVMAITGSSVGIGTTSPTAKLHVSGTSGGIFEVDGLSAVNALFVSSSGNIGIGTSNPYNYPNYRFITIDDTSGAGVTFRTSGTERASFYGYSGGADILTAGYLQVYAGGSVRMYVASGGSVGINTTSPATALHVFGTVRAARLNATGGFVDFDAETGNNFIGVSSGNMSLANNGTVNLYISGSGRVGIGTTSPTAKLVVVEGGASGAPLMTFIGNASNGNYMRTSWVTSTLSGLAFLNVEGNTAMDFGSTVNMPLKLYTNNAVVMTLTGSNVGIGTTNPIASLHVNGYATTPNNQGWCGINTSGNITQLIALDSSNRTIIGTTSNASVIALTGTSVGIGTTSPAEKLDISGSVIIRAASGNSDLQFIAAARPSIYVNSTNIGLQVRSNGTGVLQLNADNSGTGDIDMNSGLVRLDADVSRVGIGTTAPTYKLDVAGQISMHDEAQDIDDRYYGGTFLRGWQSFSAGNEASITYTTDTTSPVGTEVISVNSYVWARGPKIRLDKTQNYEVELWIKRQTANTAGTFYFVVSNYDSSGNIISGDGTDWNYPTSVSPLSATWTKYRFVVGPYGGTKDHSSSARYISVGFIANYTSGTDVIYMTGFKCRPIPRYNNDALTIYNSGNVGIGTTNATDELTINSAGNSTGIVIQRSGVTKGRLEIGSSSDTFSVAADSATGLLSFGTAGSERMRIQADGNVGIGTTSPAVKLDVIGNARIGQTSNSSTNASLDITAGGSGYDSYIDFGYWNTFDASIYRMGYYGSLSGVFKITDNGAGPAYDRMVISGGTITFPSSSIGIGTTSPSTLLNLASAAPVIRLNPTTQNNATAIEFGVLNAGTNAYAKIDAINLVNYDTNLRFYTNASGTTTQTEKMRITSDGNVGIGSTSPAYKLDVSGISAASTRFEINNTSYDQPNAFMVRAGDTNWSYGSYNVSSNYWMQVRYYGTGDDTRGFRVLDMNGSVVRWRTNGAGNMYATGDVVAYSSDKRLKENIKPIEGALEKVMSLSGVTFDWNQKAIDAGFIPRLRYNDAGVIAQEVQAVLPQAVDNAPFDWQEGKSRSGENYLTVKYEKVVPLLIEAIKEQQRQIDELKYLLSQK